MNLIDQFELKISFKFEGFSTTKQGGVTEFRVPGRRFFHKNSHEFFLLLE